MKSKEVAKVRKKDWHLIEFSAPITENAFIDDEFIIKGTAINETTTHNGHKYIAEELEKAGQGLIGKPLLIDHDNSVEAIVGRVKDSTFNNDTKSIQFEAKINNTEQGKHVQQLIKAGDLSTVSIGAFAEDLIQEEDSDVFIAKGLTFAELSLVAIPADEGATFATAFANNYDLKEKMENTITFNAEDGDAITLDTADMNADNDYTDERGYGEMKEENSQKLDKKIVEKPVVDLKIVEELSTLKEDHSKLNEELLALRKEKMDTLHAKYKTLCKEKDMKEKDLSKISEETLNLLIEQLEEMKMESVKKELKGVVSEEETSNLTEELKDFVLDENGGVFMMPKVKRIFELHNMHSRMKNGS